jgi:hypothetical protein
MPKNKKSPGVHIQAGGDVRDNVIAGHDVEVQNLQIGDRSAQEDKAPTLEEFKQLLAEIQADLAEITAREEALKAVSPAAPFSAQGAGQSLKDAAEKVSSEMKPEEVEPVHKRLAEAGAILSGILSGAKNAIEKTAEIAGAVGPLVEKLGPLVEKVGIASLWAARLWPPG